MNDSAYSGHLQQPKSEQPQDSFQSRFKPSYQKVRKEVQPKKIGNQYLHIHTRTLPNNYYSSATQNYDLYDYLMSIYDLKARVDLFNFSLNQKYLFFYRQKAEIGQSQHVVIEKSPIKKKYPSYLHTKATLLFGVLLTKRGQKYYLKILQPNNIPKKQSITKYDSTEPVYQIVRMSMQKQRKELKQQGVKLKFGQVVRMGKSIYRIASLKFGNQKQQKRITNQVQMKSLSPNEKVYKHVPAQPEEGQSMSQVCCRVCLNNTQPSQVGDNVDYLINPCLCKGSHKYIHFLCLQHWMKSRVMKNQVDGAIQFNFKRYQCQICKTPYPRYFQFENKIIEMVPVTKPIEEHIMFEGVSEQSSSLLIIEKFQNPVKMGRNITNDVIMQEMSVSRTHSEIVKKADGFYILDEISKFGTLVMHQQMEIELSENRRAFQVGHSIFCFNLMWNDDEYRLPQPQNVNNGRNQYKLY